MKAEVGKKGGRKIGRLLRKPSHNRYNAEMRYEKNKVRRAKRHVKRHPNDKVPVHACKPRREAPIVGYVGGNLVRKVKP